MTKFKTQSNIIPNKVVIDFTIVDVNLNIETKHHINEKGVFETYYEYDTYRFDKSELLEADTKKIKVEALIRCKYSLNDEMAILRQKDAKQDEYNAYYSYVEQCKEEAIQNENDN